MRTLILWIVILGLIKGAVAFAETTGEALASKHNTALELALANHK